MQVRVTAILALFLGVIGVNLVIPSAALATQPGPVPVVSTLQASPEEEEEEEGPVIQGKLTDESEAGEPEPVEGVRITVLDSSGAEVGSDTSDSEGEFAIPVPGSGTYTVQVDVDTLPEGTFLRNPQDIENTVTISGFDKTVLFPLGPDTRQVTGTATEIVELVTGGLLFGLILALSALGLSMIFGTTGLTNFAHGELVTFGALIALILNVSVGLPVIVAGVLAVMAGALFGWFQDAFMWRQLRRRGTGLIAMMIVAIGMAIFLRALYQYIIGGNREAYSDYVTQQPIVIGLFSMPPRDMIIAAVAFVVLMLATTALQRTRTGKAMRAVADNPPLAASSGINVDRVISVVWIGGTALAALGGFLYTLKYQMDYQMGLRLLLLIFAAVILGGIGTIWGAILGALIVSMFTELSTLFIPAELKYTGALFVMIVILLFRPTGLLNRAQRVG